ncbi:MAG TPA: hypothetical protein VFU21_21175, partial [Kofleriaceae bacterium]|nr:hypothetical protein [Kofleriaceae bacterium]
MSSGGRRRGRRLERLRADVEKGGHAFFTTTWSVAVWILWLVVRPLGRVAAWFRDLPRRGQLVVGAGAIALTFACLLAFRHTEGVRLFSSMTEREALARVIRSEIGSGSAQQRLHVAWATRNLAAERRQSVVEMACSPCGPQELGRPVSSRQEAREVDRMLADAVLAAPAILDPTGGATHFINPVLQDQLVARKAPGYTKSYERVRKLWSGSYGWE